MATMSKVGDTIQFTDYQVSKPAQNVKVQLSFKLHMPGLPDETPDYVWRNAARNIWIALQGKLRVLNAEAIKGFNGFTFDGSDIAQHFETKGGKVDTVTKAQRLMNKMTAEEKQEFLAALQASK